MSFDKDDMILEELKAQNIKGFTTRGKFAITELANNNEGAMIFLILSLNSRIRDLEEALNRVDIEVIHH